MSQDYVRTSSLSSSIRSDLRCLVFSLVLVVLSLVIVCLFAGAGLPLEPFKAPVAANQSINQSIKATVWLATGTFVEESQ